MRDHFNKNLKQDKEHIPVLDTLTLNTLELLGLLGIWGISTIVMGLLMEYSSNKSKARYNKLH